LENPEGRFSARTYPPALAEKPMLKNSAIGGAFGAQFMAFL
jgi:hypothetical protein